eukprot:Gb_26298 [translate_table: standard]
MEQPRASVDLNPIIWRNLPGELLENVLVRLPVRSLVRFLSVCKGWKQGISSKPFLNTLSYSPYPCFAFFKPTIDCFQACNPTANECHTISLSFMPYKPVGIFACAGGLICDMRVVCDNCHYEAGCLALFVCNPILKKWKRLPPLPEGRYDRIVYSRVLNVVVDKNDGKYKVITASRDENVDVMDVDVYDSSTDTWRLFRLPFQGLRYTISTTICNNILYVFSGLCSQGIYFLDILEHKWGKIEAPMPQGLRDLWNIVECQGRLLMVGKTNKGIKVDAVRVWELQKDEREIAWKKMARMPTEIFDKLCPEKTSHTIVTGHGCLIYFLTTNREAFVLDIIKTRWFNVSLQGIMDQVCSFSFFEPSLNAGLTTLGSL